MKHYYILKNKYFLFEYIFKCDLFLWRKAVFFCLITYVFFYFCHMIVQKSFCKKQFLLSQYSYYYVESVSGRGCSQETKGQENEIASTHVFFS